MRGFIKRRKAGMRVCCCVLCLAVALSLLSVVSRVYGEGSEEASSAIADAESKIAGAYLAVHSAEGAGANVSKFKVKLDEAGGLLAEANVAFRVGDYTNASLLAEQCSSLVDGVVGEAGSLRREAEGERVIRLFFVASLSSVGLSFLYVAGFFGWRFLRGRYEKRLLGMKPEVTEVDESGRR